MNKHTLAKRIISLMLVMSFLGLLFSTNSSSGYKSDPLSSCDDAKIISTELHTIARGICSQELLPSKNARITHSDTTKPQNRLKSFDNCFSGGQILFTAAAALCLLLFQAFGQVICLKRYIIRYIHDQDGYKGISSLYCLN